MHKTNNSMQTQLTIFFFISICQGKQSTYSYQSWTHFYPSTLIHERVAREKQNKTKIFVSFSFFYKELRNEGEREKNSLFAFFFRFEDEEKINVELKTKMQWRRIRFSLLLLVCFTFDHSWVGNTSNDRCSSLWWTFIHLSTSSCSITSSIRRTTNQFDTKFKNAFRKEKKMSDEHFFIWLWSISSIHTSRSWCRIHLNKERKINRSETIGKLTGSSSIT